MTSGPVDAGAGASDGETDTARDAAAGDIAALRERFGTFDEPVEQGETEPDEAAVTRAMADAARVLTATQLSETELRRRLRRREHPEAVVDVVIGRCRTAGYVDDDRYARSFVESRLRRGHGARRIRSDLSTRGIGGDLVEPLLADAREDGTTAEGAWEAVLRRHARTDVGEPKGRARVLRFLQSRGFMGDEVTGTLRRLEQHQRDGAADEHGD